MSRSNWGIVAAAVVGLAFITFGAGYFLGVLNYPQEQRYQPYEYTSDNPAPVATAADQASTAKYREPCKEPKGHDESDLCAQWKAARAAETNTLWTARAFWVGLVSIVGLGATIVLTLRATNAAQRSALAAEKAVEGSDRPYLLLTE